jgi:hypothetical protein
MSHEPDPITLYISSDDIDYFQSSSRITMPLSNTIYPDEGYVLQYGLRSVGFNAAAFNITEQQKNNRLLFAMKYDLSDVQHYPGEVIHPLTPFGSPAKRHHHHHKTKKHDNGSDELYIKLESRDEWKKSDNLIWKHLLYNEQLKIDDDILTAYIEFVVPDGYYTLQSLFAYLNGRNHNDSIIPTCYFRDYINSLQTEENIVPLHFAWTLTSYGYSIGIVDDSFPSTIEFKSEYGVIEEIGGTFGMPHSLHVEELFPKLRSIAILPHPEYPILYETLFTNYNTQDPNTPISSSSANPKTGFNPPMGVHFIFDFSFHEEYRYPGRHIDNVQITELGNEKHYDIANDRYPNQKKINTHIYSAYYTPSLDPTYIDIEISLPNHSMDGRSQRNILTRIFAIDAISGANAYYRFWENPKKTSLDSIMGFSSITLEFKAHEAKWNFFNLEFSIELEIYQSRLISDEGEEDPNAEALRSLPPTDVIDDAVKEAGERQIHPFHPDHFSHVAHRKHGSLSIAKKRRR